MSDRDCPKFMFITKIIDFYTKKNVVLISINSLTKNNFVNSLTTLRY